MTNAIILLPHLHIQNANAISGPFTWGFPSPTAFSGFSHALQRKLQQHIKFDETLQLGSVGIVCHQFNAQISQPSLRKHKVFNLTRNPVGKEGKSAALVEEGRCHMEISLIIEVQSQLDQDEQNALMKILLTSVHSMRIAGGSILAKYSKRHQPEWCNWPENNQDSYAAWRKLRYRLLPGFALVERPDLLNEHLQLLKEKNTNSNMLDALLDLSRLNVEATNPETNKPEWHYRRKSGWLVPIPVGYAAISELYPSEQVANTRDQDTPFRFVESLYSLGQWLSPHRLENLNQLLWQQHAPSESGIYRCNNHYANTIKNT